MSGLLPSILSELRDECIDRQENGCETTLKSSGPPCTNNQRAQHLALDVVNLRKHLLERLLEDEEDEKIADDILPEKALGVHNMLLPLVEFISGDITVHSMKDFSGAICDISEKLSSQTNEVFYLKILLALNEKLEFASWCLNQLFIGPSLTPKKVFEICLEFPYLNALKVLGGLQLVSEKEIQVITVKEPLFLNTFRSYSAVVEFVHYLYQCFPRMKMGSSLEEVEGLLSRIEPPEVQLQIMEDLFALFFLRREDILFEESASESGESEELLLQSKTPARSKCNSEQCASNSNSPNSQTGTSSGALAEKNGISLGFLCQHSDKLQLSLKMLQRRIEHLDVKENSQFSLRLRKLERYIKEALWRLVLLQWSDSSTGHRCSSHNFSRGDGCVSIRKAWIARLPVTLQTCFHHAPTRRKLRTKLLAKKSVPPDPRLINRLLADPLSLMVMAMMDGNLPAARQVADLHQLWATDPGKQLEYSLAHATASQELLHKAVTVRQREMSSENWTDSTAQSLNGLSLPSSIETLLSTLLQAMPTRQGDSEDAHSALLLADLVTYTTSLLRPEEASFLLDILWQRCQRMSVDADLEPWKSLRHLVDLLMASGAIASPSEGMRDCAPAIKSPTRTPLPLDVNLLRKQSDALNQLGVQYRQLEASLKTQELWSKLEEDFRSVADRTAAIADTFPAPSTPTDKHLIHLCSYVEILRQLAPLRLHDQSPALLLSQDIGALIMERLREGAAAIKELETPATLLGLQLPCFLAKCLRSEADESTATPLHFSSDADFIGMLLTYLDSKCPLLAQMVDLELRVEQNVPLNSSTDPHWNGTGVDLSIYRRFLERRKKGHQAQVVIFAHDQPKRRQSMVIVPEPPTLETCDIHNMRSQAAGDRLLGHLILESVPATLVTQLEHLVTQPFSMMEQMLMNGQIAAAARVINLARLHSSNPDVQDFEINDILRLYASKALFLGLPEVQTSARRSNEQQQPQQQPKKKKSAVFVIPAVVPPKDQWVADADVGQCPCCSTVQFSMFNRRHHCRRCGRVVCAACSPHRQLVDGYGDVPMRTCNDCFTAMHGNVAPIRAAHHDGQILWMLSLDPHHNEIVRREFSYEHAPNLALALAIVQLCREKDEIAHFLLNQSSAMLAALHRYLLGGALFEVDPIMVLQLIKSLILTAKMRYSEIGIVTPTKGKPSRGLARCDALLGQIDLLSLLASANCLHLLPAQSLAQLDTWRKLRDRLIEIELWSLALDISTKAGLDAASVWAAWGLVCLRAGNFQGARQRFQRCLKPAKTSPLLQEIVSVLESLNIPFLMSSSAAIGGSSTSINSGVSSSASLSFKRSRKLTPPHPQAVASDKPELIISSLSRLKDICAGNFETGDKDDTLEEILFYLGTYGSAESPYVYLVERKRIDTAVHQFYSHSTGTSLPVDVFNQGLLLPCLRTGCLEDLIFEMKRHDASLRTWETYLMAAAHLLDTKSFWNSLYQLYCLASDHLRACLIAVRRLYLSDLFSVETFICRSELLEEILAHLRTYQIHTPFEPKGKREKQDHMPLWWPAHQVLALQRSVQLQLDVTEFIDQCYRAGRITPPLLAVLKSVTQGSADNQPASSAGDLYYAIPSLLGSRADRCACSVLVTVSSPSSSGFQLSWRICTEQRIRLDRYFRLSAFVLIKQFQVAALILLVDFMKQRTAADSVASLDVDELLVECASLVQDRDREHKSQDTELIVQQIKKPTIKIRAYINVGWLKSAYLLAVQNGLVSDVINIQQEAGRLQQSAVLTLCNKWLAARNNAK